MNGQSDLIVDSKLDTRFESRFTVHNYREVSTNSERRQREEYWRQIREIGSGAYGCVWLEKCEQGYQDVELRAVKEISMRPSRSGRQIDFSRELEAIAKFSHNKYTYRFIKSYGWYQRDETLCIAMEYLPHGDLEQYLFKTPPLSEESTGDIVYQILEGLSFMHENKFAHRDLKPGNILIKSCPPQRWWIKIGDFGISKRLEDETTNSTLRKGTPGFIAPELLELTSGGTPFAVDMWALGEITFQLLTKQAAFRSFGVLAKYVTQSNNFPSEALFASHVSVSGQDFISLLMVAIPETRLTAEAALKHEWMGRYLPLAIQPSPPPQITRTFSAEDSIDGVFASWNSISISDSPRVDLTQTLRPKLNGNHRPPQRHHLRPSAPRDVRGEGTPIKMMKYYLGELRGHTSSVLGVAFSPDGATIASASGDKSVRTWDAGTGKPLRELRGHTGRVRGVAFSPDGATIASASDDQSVRTWDAGTGKPLRELRGHTGRVWGVAFSPDGATIASASDDRSVRTWDAGTGKPLRELRGHTARVWGVAFSPDGATIASASDDRSVRTWDAGTGKPLRELRGHTGAVLDVAFSPDGATIASASDDRSVRTWDAGTGKPLRELRGHTGAVLDVAFSPDGATIASASGDQSVRTWDAGTGKPLRELRGHTGRVWGVAFSPDGATIASASDDRSVRTWDAENR